MKLRYFTDMSNSTCKAVITIKCVMPIIRLSLKPSD